MACLFPNRNLGDGELWGLDIEKKVCSLDTVSQAAVRDAQRANARTSSLERRLSAAQALIQELEKTVAEMQSQIRVIDHRSRQSEADIIILRRENEEEF